MSVNPFCETSPAGRCYQHVLNGDLWQYEQVLIEDPGMAEFLLYELEPSLYVDPSNRDYSDILTASNWDARLVDANPDQCWWVTGSVHCDRAGFTTKEKALSYIETEYCWSWDQQCQGCGMAYGEGSFTLTGPDGSKETR